MSASIDHLKAAFNMSVNMDAQARLAAAPPPLLGRRLLQRQVSNEPKNHLFSVRCRNAGNA